MSNYSNKMLRGGIQPSVDDRVVNRVVCSKPQWEE